MLFRSFALSGWITVALATGLGGLASAEDAKPAPTTQPYPLTVCVVSDEKLGGDMGEPKIIQYEGREVRFCCPDCEKDFRKDPQKYLKKLDEAAAKAASTQRAATQPAATIYACPMHLNETADKPGKCRKCGMELQAQKSKVDGSAGAGHVHEHAGHTQ